MQFFADAHACAHNRAGLDARTDADARTCLNHRAGANRDMRAQLGMCTDHRRGMYAHQRRSRHKQSGRSRKPQPRLLSLYDALAVRIDFGCLRLEHHDACIARKGGGGCGRRICEGHLQRLGLLAGVDAVHGPLWIALRQPSAQLLDQFAQRHS